MGRNSELIRQWTLLQRLATRRSNTIPALATDLRVSTRTIRRDLEALQSAGFPIYDDMANGTKFWRLDARTLVEALPRNALTVPELCALYSSRALVKGIAGTHLLTNLQSALDKIETALPSGMKRFLDRLPSLVVAKPLHGRARDADAHDAITRLFEAASQRRVISMQYDSAQSRRVKQYTVHPYRLVFAQNGLYLQAFVPAYKEFRTFLVSRIRKLTVEQQCFERVAELGADPFSKSLGVHAGPTVKVRLRFAPQVAPIIKERVWHDSQQLEDRQDGSLVVSLQVSDDYALRQWILGFGRSVRVLAPQSLVEWILEELETTGQQYLSGKDLAAGDPEGQPVLPFLFGHIGQT